MYPTVCDPKNPSIVVEATSQSTASSDRTVDFKARITHVETMYSRQAAPTVGEHVRTTATAQSHAVSFTFRQPSIIYTEIML